MRRLGVPGAALAACGIVASFSGSAFALSIALRAVRSPRDQLQAVDDNDVKVGGVWKTPRPALVSVMIGKGGAWKP